MTTRYISREIRPPKDLPLIESFLAGSPRYETLLMRPALEAQRNRAFDGWWYGCLADATELRALMCVEGTSANLYGRDIDALDAMAADLLRSQGQFHTSATHRHQLLGEERALSRFWSGFQAIGRQVIVDRRRTLMGSTGEPARPSSRVAVGPATASDLPLAVQFTAEHALETWGADPRMGSAEAYRRRCEETIGQKRLLVGREGPRAILVAEMLPLDDAVCMLDKVFVPKPLRARKRLVAKAIAGVLDVPALQGKEVLFFADGEALVEAAKLAGFVERCPYRVVAMRG